MVERLKANWYHTAGDVAAMTQDELEVLKVPVKLWHLLRHSCIGAAAAAPTAAAPTAPTAVAPAAAPGAAGAVQPVQLVPASTAATAAPPKPKAAVERAAAATAALSTWPAGTPPLPSPPREGSEAVSGQQLRRQPQQVDVPASAAAPISSAPSLPEDIMQRRMPRSSMRRQPAAGRAASGVGAGHRATGLPASGAAAAAAFRTAEGKAAGAGTPLVGAASAAATAAPVAVVAPVRVLVRRKPLRSTEAYGLKDCELNAVLDADLGRLERFCCTSFYGQRVPPVKLVTYNTVTRFYVKLMLGWQHRIKGVPLEQLSLKGVLPSTGREAVALLLEYQQWREHMRGCSVSSHGNAIKACIALARFLYHGVSKPDPDRRVPPYHDLELVQELSRMMRASQRAAARAPRVAEESRKWLQWDEYLGLVRAMRAECAGLTANGVPRSPREVAASLQRYLIFAILSAIPDRQRTLRELEVGRTLVKDEQGRWVIRHGPDDYKTGKQYGERPLLVLPSFLYPELEAFLATWRQHLKPQHLGLFCRESDGGQFKTGGVTSLFKAAALRLTGRATNPHLVRDMVVTNLRSRGCSEVEMESLAVYMGHSLLIQRSTYDRRTHAQRVAPAQELLLGLSAKHARVA